MIRCSLLAAAGVSGWPSMVGIDGPNTSASSRPTFAPCFASDSADYAAWTLLRFLRAPDFAWTPERADDWRKPWPDFLDTRYHRKAAREGRAPTYLVFRRR